jgi:hypothetical protein
VCGREGATIQRPSLADEQIGLMPFPMDRIRRRATMSEVVRLVSRIYYDLLIPA